MVTITIKPEKLDYYGDEAYKSLRTNIQFCGQDKKVIAITSCTPNEGKSSVSMNLAVSLAESGKKVLMIDADLRKSVMVGRAKVNQSINGLSHYLSKQKNLTDVVCVTDVKNLHIIFAGPVPPNPAELLGSALFKELLATTRGVYDYILIDTPPLGSVIDSAIVAEECDGAVLVIEAGVISYRFAQEVKSQLEKSNCPILGAILNKVDTHKQGYYSKYYGKYYGKKYYGKYTSEYKK